MKYLLLLLPIAFACGSTKTEPKSKLEFIQDTIPIRNDSSLVIVAAQYEGELLFDTKMEVRTADLMNKNLGERANRFVAKKLLAEGKLKPEDTLHVSWR